MGNGSCIVAFTPSLLQRGRLLKEKRLGAPIPKVAGPPPTGTSGSRARINSVQLLNRSQTCDCCSPSAHVTRRSPLPFDSLSLPSTRHCDHDATVQTHSYCDFSVNKPPLLALRAPAACDFIARLAIYAPATTHAPTSPLPASTRFPTTHTRPVALHRERDV